LDSARAMILVAVADAAAGTDTVYAVTVSSCVADAGGGHDAIAAVQVSLAVADAASGVDAPAIMAQFSVADTGAGIDYVGILQAVLKMVSDDGQGADSVSGISAIIPVSDAGAGADYVGLISALLAVADAAAGVDVVVRFTTGASYRRVDITFTPRHGRVTFAAKQGGVKFDA
ncbi:MAG TPA: hypothetical protein VLL97_00020, partial [Acidobacteriota bacterium]|nr:hypothetical protein [Acidobacteriota bacterium]